jgi:hypothetical protein
MPSEGLKLNGTLQLQAYANVNILGENENSKAQNF